MSSGLGLKFWLIRSRTTKSLPVPCIFVNCSCMSVSTGAVPRRAGGQAVFSPQQVGDGFALPHQIHVLAVDHDLGGATAGVVVGAHGEAVGTRAEHGEQVALPEIQRAILAQKVSRLTHRPHNVPMRKLSVF